MSRALLAVVVCVAACSVDLLPPEDGAAKPVTGGTSSGGAAGVPPFGGTGGGLAGSGGFDSGVDSSTGDPCTDCESTSCASDYDACVNSSDCTSLSACMNNCSDPYCQNACYTSYGNGYGLYYEVVACSYGTCATHCNVPQQCFDCETASCSAPMNACVNDVDCLAYSYCVAASDASSYSYCGNLFGATVVTEYGNFAGCVTSACGSLCTAS